MTAYQTFKTHCAKCNKGLSVVGFNVSIGFYSFALCPKHLKEVEKILTKWGIWEIWYTGEEVFGKASKTKKFKVAYKKERARLKTKRKVKVNL